VGYDYKKELQRVKDYYAGDPLQKRFSALVTSESGAGKTFMLRTARFPIHIDSFDPGGTKCLRPWIESGDVIADTQWENEDPFSPKVFAEWAKTVDIRVRTGYFDHFGTYALDSLSTFGDAVMNDQLMAAGRAGEVPQMRRDYNPQKTNIVNRIKKLMTLKCDFFLMGHLRTEETVIGETKGGESIKSKQFRLNVTGNAVVTIPLLFDELWVLVGKETSSGIDRKILTDAQGQYIARSRLKSNGKLDSKEDPDIKKILKKVGLDWEDKAKLDV